MTNSVALVPLLTVPGYPQKDTGFYQDGLFQPHLTLKMCLCWCLVHEEL